MFIAYNIRDAHKQRNVSRSPTCTLININVIANDDNVKYFTQLTTPRRIRTRALTYACEKLVGHRLAPHRILNLKTRKTHLASAIGTLPESCDTNSHIVTSHFSPDSYVT